MNDFIHNISPLQTIAVLLVITIITHFVLGKILKQITKHSGSTKTQIDDYLIRAISAPLKLLIWYGWLYFSLKELTSEIQSLNDIVGYIAIFAMRAGSWSTWSAGKSTCRVAGKVHSRNLTKPDA